MLRSCLGVFSRNLFYIFYYSSRLKFDSKAAISYIIIDANNLSQSPHGANFLPQLPPVSVEPNSIDPFPNYLEEEFNTYLLTNNNRKLLTSRRR
jgi:hypothetical protein